MRSMLRPHRPKVNGQMKIIPRIARCAHPRHSLRARLFEPCSARRQMCSPISTGIQSLRVITR